MKNILLLGICLLALSLISANAYADVSVSIQNSSTSSIGTVRLNLTSTTYDDKTIGGSGLYGPYNEPSLVSITINGQTTYVGVFNVVYLSDVKAVKINWTLNGGQIIITVEDY